MITVQQARKERERHRVQGKFHIAHFPVGTVVELESPSNRFLQEGERINEFEHYARSTHTVAGVVSNGANSWVIERAEKCKLGNWLDAINITYVRRIIKRGDGNLYGEEKELVERIREERAEFLNSHRGSHRGNEFESSFSKGTYRTFSIAQLCRHAMNTRKGNADKDHLIDFDKLVALVVKTLKPVWREWYVDINKKRFAKAFDQAYSKSKMSRRKAAADDYRESMKQWERELEHDYANGDL